MHFKSIFQACGRSNYSTANNTQKNETKSLETFFLTFQLEYIHWLTTRLNILNTLLLAHTAFVKNQ